MTSNCSARGWRTSSTSDTPLVRLARLIDWRIFEDGFGVLYAEAAGRQALPSRLMVALHLLKHMDGLSDEAVCALSRRSVCPGFLRRNLFPAHPAARSIFDDPLAAAERGGAVAEKHYERVAIDTTVFQPKAVTHPTDSKPDASNNPMFWQSCCPVGDDGGVGGAERGVLI